MTNELNFPLLKKIPQTKQGGDICEGCYLKENTESCWNDYLADLNEDCGGVIGDPFIFVVDELGIANGGKSFNTLPPSN